MAKKFEYVEEEYIMKIKTILVVEDNELNMKLVKGLIKIGKYRMLEATDAESGILLIREQRPDLVLMDIQLPGMDGLSATKIIKEDPSLKDIPIVALTSYAMQGDKEKALQAGCTGYIAKPIDTRKFLKTIAQYLNGANPGKS
jgi:CheY-like chemotaxis protein